MLVRDLQLPGDPDSLIRNFTSYEFSLDELGLPPADVLYNAVKHIEKRIGLQGFSVFGRESISYKGFSLTYNPDYVGSVKSPYHQTMGDRNIYGPKSLTENKQANPDMYVGVNSYYDSYGYNHIHSFIKEQFKSLFDRLYGAVVRSRVAYLYSNEVDLAREDLFWHRDEPGWEMLRLVIPVKTSNNFKIQIDGKDPVSPAEVHTEFIPEIGKAYIWNNHINHRQYPVENKPQDDPRIYIIIGISPWFDFIDNKFVPNENWGYPIDMIVENNWFIREET